MIVLFEVLRGTGWGQIGFRATVAGFGGVFVGLWGWLYDLAVVYLGIHCKIRECTTIVQVSLAKNSYNTIQIKIK